ncbi:hypothetical protein [uncultured Psychroserpens sp.]|uniref:hypothetical protein n=1 Tax=uncultured Psychroserpens sp. TaxID=255436 RepID=UPI002612EF6F|nr:hypothetical protein [uncultured Psychroserpens sp.]
MKYIQLLLVACLLTFICISKQSTKKIQKNSHFTEGYNSYSCENLVKFFQKVDSTTAKNRYIWNKNIYGPVLLIDDKNGKYYANTNPDEEAFAKNYTCYEGTLPKDKMLGSGTNTIVKWKNKVWAVATLPLSTIPGFDIDVVTHELTHVELESRGHSTGIQNTSHLVTYNGRILMRLELELLKKFITNDRNDIQLLKDALSIRQLRHQEFSSFKMNENSLEHNEGLANYSGIIMANLTKIKIKSFFTMLINRFVQSERYGRDFAYLTITIYGMKLRESDSLWTQKVNPNTDLTDFMIKAFKVDKLPRDLKYYTSKYDFLDILEQEKNIVEKQKRSIDSITRIFLNGPHLKVKFEKAAMSTSPEDFLLNDMGRHFSFIRVTDSWGELNATKGIVISPDFRVGYLRIPKDYSSNTIVGEGYTLNLKDKYKIVKESDSVYVLKKSD